MHNSFRGEKSPVAKLTTRQAQEILQRNLSGERHKAFAQEFGVSADSIGKLVRGLRWKELEGNDAERVAAKEPATTWLSSMKRR